jgi:hypothetical protein
MPSIVRVTSTGDSHAMGRARVRLKLAAIGYVNSRHGIDTDAGLTRAGRALLYTTALEYYEAVTGADPKKRAVEPDFKIDNPRLNIAAIAYVNARHGIDADVGLSRAGLALLCNAAIEYCEVLMGGAPRKRPIDPALQLENGA